MLLFTYITLLLLIIFAILVGLKLCTRVPNKIKVLSSITLFLLLLRYISLFAMFLEDNSKYMYMSKPLYFLYFACVPILGFISSYILWRNDKINFRYMAMVSYIYIIMYFVCILKIPANVLLFYKYNFGYIINLNSNFWYIDILYLLINIAILIIAVRIFNKNGSDKIGSTLVIFASLSTIVIIMLPYLLHNFIPQYVLNELLWVIALDYCLLKIGKKT